jgi:hypothetical protein
MLGRCLGACMRAATGCVAEAGERDAKSGVTMRFDYVTLQLRGGC